MKREILTTTEQPTHEVDYFILITNICVVIIMLVCVFIYLVAENKINIADNACQNINSFFNRTQLRSIALLSSVFLFIPIIYKNKTESKVHKIAELLKYTISLLAVLLYMAYVVTCL